MAAALETYVDRQRKRTAPTRCLASPLPPAPLPAHPQVAAAVCALSPVELITVITCDGRNIVVHSSPSLSRCASPTPLSPPLTSASPPPLCPLQGVLRGFDQTINVILDESYERILSPTEPGQRIDLGLYLIRGENVAVVGELDEEKDKALKVADQHADVIKPVVH